MLISSSTRLAQLIRFAVVGGFSTGMFLIGQYLFVGLLRFPVILGTTLSFAIGISISYIGHHAITFRRSGAHLHYGPRFVVVTALMLVISNLLAYGMVTVAGVNYLSGSLVIAIVYPVGSFVLQSLWVFAERSASGDSLSE